MEPRDVTLDNLQRHMAEIMRQFVGGDVNSEARENARRYLHEAEDAVEQLREELEQMEVAVRRARAELQRLTGDLTPVRIQAA